MQAEEIGMPQNYEYLKDENIFKWEQMESIG